MSGYKNFNNLKAKMDKECSKQLLTCNFNADRYPIVLTIAPDKDPAAQMALFSVDDGASSADASLEYRFTTKGIDVRISGRLYLPEEAMNKLKNLAKKMVAAYLFDYFAEQKAKGCDTPSHDMEDEEPEANTEAFEDFFEDEENRDGAGE